MEREILTFTERELIAGIVLGYDETDKWEVIYDDVYDQGRWTTSHEVVVKRLEDGKFFMTHYTVGSTESQDQRAFEYDDLVLKEVIPEETIVIKYIW